jgi:hypothetical protein
MTSASPPRPHRGLSIAALVVASSALGGALGLATGAVALGAELNGRLPFASPVLAGAALLVAVAVPFFVVAWMAWRGAPGVEQLAFLAGLALAGWIVVQLVVIRELSFFQPLYLVIAVAFMAVRRRAVGIGSPEAADRPERAGQDGSAAPDHSRARDTVTP